MNIRSMPIVCLVLAGCAGAPVPVEPQQGEPAPVAETQHAERERLLAELERCREARSEEIRRGDLHLREANRKNERLHRRLGELEAKLNAMVEIDRDMRRRGRR